ncbi:MAG: protein translocase subunit SecD [Candidatus Eisenbacteria bacterium]|nr:protein translocase subunit SecD [Candidatus Eisenbacteria bacterium]
MKRTELWRIGIIAVSLLLALWYLFPSFRLYRMSASARSSVVQEKLDALRDKALRLGLDLQGGMHLVLEVDKAKLTAAEAEDAADRAMEVIRNRVDQFGVTEPLIQKQGKDRIVIQLPGLLDADRAKALIGQTAMLEFKIVKTEEEAKRIMDRLDSYFSRSQIARQLGGDSLTVEKPVNARILTFKEGAAFFETEETAPVENLLASSGIDTLLPGDASLSWGYEEEAFQGRAGKFLYVLDREPLLTGSAVANAIMGFGLEEMAPNAPGVSLTMTGKGGAKFAKLTGNNVGRELAIVLDNKVRSAPVIRERIPGGRASITGRFDEKEAKDLAVVLRTGALPAPVNVVEERTVGPSLGRDSINMGVRAGIIGSILVVLFMVGYYRVSGLLAIGAVVVNTLFILAVLAGFHATLTLPGLAGIVLTIGMAVDANVLVFERIREELRNKKTVRAAIDAGYTRAFRTILDSNVTTLISALFLFQFGTGPIKGFAVTLSIGLLANMYTAVFCTRVVFDMITARKRVEKLSI